MFPIPWNKQYRKKDGTLVNIDDAISEGGSSELPPHSAADAGKVLGIDDEGNFAWVTISSGVRQYSVTRITASKNAIDLESEGVNT